MRLLSLLLLAPTFLALAQESKLRLVRETDALTPKQQQAKLHVPEGFEVQLFASEPMINKPINMAFDSRGRLWVSSTVEYPYSAAQERWSDTQGTHVKDSRDAIKILEDTDGDGKADKVTDFANELNIPTGVLPWHKPEHKAGCIAWSIPNIWYFADTDGDDKADLREVLFGPLGYEKDTHGMCSSFRLGLDGWVYATHGFSNTSRFEVLPQHFKPKSPDERPDTLELNSGNVFRFRPDGSHVELWSAGQVNPFGLCWDRYNNLYSADCHSNPITQLLRGACYPSFGKPHDGLGFAPNMCEHSHGSTGLCGIVYIDGGVWGPEWDDHMFLGNCVTSVVNHDHVTFTGSTPKANEKPDFVTSEDPWFRPVDLQLGPDKALYIADFYNKIIGHYEVPLEHPGRDKERGRIWRVVKKDHQTPPKDFTKMDAKAIGNELGSPNLTRRHLALGEVKRRGTKEWLPLLMRPWKGEGGVEGKLYSPLGDATPKDWDPKDASPSDFFGEYVIPWESYDMRTAHSLWALSYLGERFAVSCVMRNLHTGGTWQEDEGKILSGLVMSHAAQIIGGYEKLHPWEKWNLGVIFDSRGSAAGRAACQVLLNRPDFLGDNPRWHSWVTPFLVELLDTMIDPQGNYKTLPWVGDPQYVHAMRVLLRDFLAHPGVLANAELRSRRDAAMKKSWFFDVVKAVPAADASVFLLERLNQGVKGDDAVWTHFARHADPATLELALAKAHAQTADSVAAQVTAIEAFHHGLLEQGSKPPPALLAWATTLAETLLAQHGEAETSWRNTATNNSDNPWCLQERKAADGATINVISSLNKDLKAPEKLTGVLQSQTFAAPEKLSFWICGHQGFPTTEANKKNLARLTDEKGAVLREAPAPRNDVAQRIDWDLTEVKGKPVRFEIVDGDNGAAYAWIGAGRFEPEVIQTSSFTSANEQQKQLKTLALILRTTAPVGLRDKLNTFLPPPPRIEATPPRPEIEALLTARRASFAKATPDATKGEALFTANCVVCHSLGGKGGLLGPQLDGIGNRGADRLIEDILDPNRNVDAHFHLHQLKLRDGTTALGFVRSDAGQVTILVDAAGNETRIPKRDIVEDQDLPQSLMPPAFGQMIPEAAFNDLLAWLLKK